MPRVAPQLTPAKHRRPAATSAGLEHLAATMARIADRAVLADIESEAVRVGSPAARCYDVRPMLDPHEHSQECIDMMSEALAYAIARGLVNVTQTTPWLMQIVTRP
jgi:hypothetical protein